MNNMNMKRENITKRFRLNPFSRIEDIMRERKLRKEKKMLQMQLAIFSGGITRMK